MRVAVVGLGYVGLPLALRFARAGVTVDGIDSDASKVEGLLRGQVYLRHIDPEGVVAAVKAGALLPTTSFEGIASVDGVIVCVPTPLTKAREPDLSYVLATARSIAGHLRPGTLVALESTTYPGTTEGEFREALEQGSGLVAGRDFHLVFSPEREDPGNPLCATTDVPKLVGGLTPACLTRALEIYGCALDNLIPVSTPREAEAAKLLENIFRSVNIALVNELKVIYAAMGIDIWAVIEAARTKPFGFMAFQPGPGLGGHCIPIDPFYLTWKAREFGFNTRFIELAGEINQSMPSYVVARVAEALNSVGRAVKGSRILVLGMAYKPDIDDTRESPSLRLISQLLDRGADVAYHDPLVPVLQGTRAYAGMAGRTSVPLTEAELAASDAVLISTAHREVDYGLVARHARLIVDTRNAMARFPECKDRVWKA
jgi:UDP-N-acetyl-D-glucosamine dehydrogenase